MIRTMQDLLSAGMNPFALRLVAKDFEGMRLGDKLKSAIHIEFPVADGKSVWVSLDDVPPEEATSLSSDPSNVCEHGDHLAPDGQRFCSPECQRCESGDAEADEGCIGVCRPSVFDAEVEDGELTSRGEDFTARTLGATTKVAWLLKQIAQAPPHQRASSFAATCRELLLQLGAREEELR